MELQETKSDLQSGHHIVSLLYSVRGLAECYFEKVKEGRLEGEERLRYAEEVLQKNREQATLALEVTRRLSRLLSRERMVSEKRPSASLEAAWQRVKSRVREQHPFVDYEVLERIPHELPAIRIRPEELEEILYVIATNAMEAMGNGNQRAERKFVLRAQISFSTREEPRVWIALADNGPGIPMERLSSLFQPFSTTKPENLGNGLGLFIVREVLAKYDGKISVASFQGWGTTFTIELPVASPQKETVPG